ncbi:helix-turn-helix domain-containing protein [Chitinophaga varians]|uniref:helix-turn-helix domain-containing protein n=1 Tax=Chitinophaga varians TaxID=2202339 RepID=UPI00165F7E82|nr:helix-turn-helix domain-containing protein [Chitinophaga varians]MBC9909107.1 helix-turn-helix domain-containing protein [Chitinophaga varians]
MNQVQKINTAGHLGITPDQLVTIRDLQQLEQNLLKSIKLLLNEMVSGDNARVPRWLKTYQAQKVLNCSVGTLLTLRNNGTLPYTKIGGTIFYNADDINRALLDRRHLHGREIPIGRSAKKT